jgi:Domain of unknown function (DUF1330)
MLMCFGFFVNGLCGDRGIRIPFDKTEPTAYAAAPASLEGLPIRVPWPRADAPDVLKGPEFEAAAIAEFPSVEDAWRWDERPLYQAAARHRFKGSIYQVLVVDGL